jgi:hypothetical protein
MVGPGEEVSENPKGDHGRPPSVVDKMEYTPTAMQSSTVLHEIPVS